MFLKKKEEFSLVKEFFETLKKDGVNEIARHELIHKKLFELILSSRSNFVLPQVVDFLFKANKTKYLSSNVSISSFEYWLNSFYTRGSIGLKKYSLIRAKITGKFIPRKEYGVYFPLTNKEFYKGSHHVTAHNNPDLDSIICSFVGWLDSFACRVSENLNYWNVPGGEPNEFSSYFLKKFYGSGIFSRVARYKSRIFNVALDLSDKSLLKYINASVNIQLITFDEGKHNILVDEEGFYIGDWQQSDIKPVQNILKLFGEALVDANDFFIEIFSSVLQSLEDKQSINFIKAKIFERPIFKAKYEKSKSEDAKHCQNFLVKILDIKQGLDVSFDELFNYLSEKSLTIKNFYNKFKQAVDLYLSEAENIYKNKEIINYKKISKIFSSYYKLYNLFVKVREASENYLNRLDIAIKIKKEILNYKDSYLLTRTSINEVAKRRRSLKFITIGFETNDNKIIPVGAINTELLNSLNYGYVSFRDFSNTDEMELDPSIKLISILDHHRVSIETDSCININIADVQSSNTLLAEIQIDINKKYSTLGFSQANIAEQITFCEKMPKDKKYFLIKKELMRLQANLFNRGDFWINEKREWQEYILFIIAILDDTDYLKKAGRRDFEILTKLLNKVIWIESKSFKETLFIDNLKEKKEIFQYLTSRDPLFSLCQEIYSNREQVISKFLENCEDYKFRLFEDCKQQKFYYSISQLKLLKGNIELFSRRRDKLINVWQNFVQLRQGKQALFHLHMNSTIINPTEFYTSLEGNDEIWIFSKLSTYNEKNALKQFLEKFIEEEIKSLEQLEISVEGKLESLKQCLAKIMPQLTIKFIEKKNIDNSIIVLRFSRGKINSRKSQITPYLWEF